MEGGLTIASFMKIKVNFSPLKILDLIVDMFLQWFFTKLQELRMKEISINRIYDSPTTFTSDCEIELRWTVNFP